MSAVGDVITRQLQALADLARALNGQVPGGPQSWGEYGDEAGAVALAVQGAAIVEATIAADASGGPPPPLVPPAAVPLFNNLARGVTFQYEAAELGSQPQTPAAWRGSAWALLTSPFVAGLPVQHIARYFENSARDRLRRCAQCRRWFVDTTRNKSARRCSRACTIAWSNRQRGQRKAPRKRGGTR